MADQRQEPESEPADESGQLLADMGRLLAEGRVAEAVILQGRLDALRTAEGSPTPCRSSAWAVRRMVKAGLW